MGGDARRLPGRRERQTARLGCLDVWLRGHRRDQRPHGAPGATGLQGRVLEKASGGRFAVALQGSDAATVKQIRAALPPTTYAQRPSGSLQARGYPLLLLLRVRQRKQRRWRGRRGRRRLHATGRCRGRQRRPAALALYSHVEITGLQSGQHQRPLRHRGELVGRYVVTAPAAAGRPTTTHGRLPVFRPKGATARQANLARATMLPPLLTQGVLAALDKFQYRR